ncbi:MAG TPA: RNA polymerase sigma factor [Kofleriaceae bacterium]|nr:RNA polymerase sigma factor [Kofleriaceae bacterium]
MTSSPPDFEQVYADCHRHVFALCRNLLGSSADAQDAMQDTFLAVAHGLPRFRGESSVRTWVHRIAVRVALKLRARRRPVEPLSDDHAAAADPVTERADQDAVTRALQSLSFEHRLVLALFGVAGLTHAEIADTLGVPEGTIWSRLHHAKRKLTAALQDLPAPSSAAPSTAHASAGAARPVAGGRR